MSVDLDRSQLFLAAGFLAVAIFPPGVTGQTGVSLTGQEVLTSQYWDGSGQLVSTVEGKFGFPLAPDWRLGIKALGEWIRIPGVPDTSNPHAGHNHGDHGGHDPGGASTDVDAVSGASIRAHGHHGTGEARGEATLSLRRNWQGSNPASLAGSLRYSGESDFHSSMAAVSGGKELFQRNTAISGFLGGGLDYSVPTDPPPGEADLWPAAAIRLAAGAQVGQLLSPRVQAGVSYAFSMLAGTLENPYRRARIITTLFPERLPDTRYRQVGAIEMGAYLGFGIAAFHCQGGYFDSWGIKAWIPETAIPVEIGKRWLITPRHKYYYQLPADFYRTSYTAREGWYTGDIRLGHLEGNEFGFEVEYSLGSSPLASTLSLSGSLSDLDYLSGNKNERSFVVSLNWKRQE